MFLNWVSGFKTIVIVSSASLATFFIKGHPEFACVYLRLRGDGPSETVLQTLNIY